MRKNSVASILILEASKVFRIYLNLHLRVASNMFISINTCGDPIRVNRLCLQSLHFCDCVCFTSNCHFKPLKSKVLSENASKKAFVISILKTIENSKILHEQVLPE